MSQASDKAAPKQEEKLPLTIAASWGIGTLAVSLGLSAQNILVLRYLTDFAGIGAGLAGSIIGLAKIYDAFTDPIMGVISDNTKSKIGRRRPYLLAGGALLTIAFLLIFNVPAAISQSWKVVYVVGALLLFATAYTIFNVPYLAMPTEMTTGLHQRSRLITFRVYTLAVSAIFASSVGPFIISHFGGGYRGHSIMAFCLAPLIVFAALICFFGTRNAPFTQKKETQKLGVVKQMSLAFENKPFFTLIGVKFCTLMNLGVASTFPFFFVHVLERDYAVLGIYLLVQQMSLIASQPFWLWISRIFGKKHCYMASLMISMCIAATWVFATPEEPVFLMYLRAFSLGFATGSALLMGQSLLPDTIEYDYLKTGLHREGLFAGVYTTIEKLAGAIGVALIGITLSAVGYIEGTQVATGGKVVQPEAAIKTIVFCVAFVPAIVDIAALFLLYRFNLTAEKLEAMRLERKQKGDAPEYLSKLSKA